MDIVVKVISPTSLCLQMYGLEVLDVTLWFMSRISKSFATRHLAVDSEWPLVCGLLQCLFMSEQQVSKEFGVNMMRLALNILVDITQCEKKDHGAEADKRSDFACVQIVKHDQACSYNDKSFWAWLNTYVASLLATDSQ